MPHATPPPVADECRAYNGQCPLAVCQASRTCNATAGTCNAPTLQANGTLCPNGSCLAGVCTGEPGFASAGLLRVDVACGTQSKWTAGAKRGLGLAPPRCPLPGAPSPLVVRPPWCPTTLLTTLLLACPSPCLPPRCADLCVAGNVTCPSTSCQANRTCDPASGLCSAPTALANGTLCPNGSCLAGVCTGEGWFCKRWAVDVACGTQSKRTAGAKSGHCLATLPPCCPLSFGGAPTLVPDHAAACLPHPACPPAQQTSAPPAM
jgi:hypothetical protein